MAEQEKDQQVCTAESCKQDLMNGLLAILAEEEEKETEHK